MFAVAVQFISKPRPVLDFSSKKGCFWYCFEKSQNGLAWPKMVFLLILANNQWFSDTSDVLANSRLTSVELVCAYVFKEPSKKLFVRTNYCLYLVFQLRSIEIDQDQFLSRNTAAGLPKNQFVASQGHPRNIWDLHIRAINEAHPTVQGETCWGIFYLLFKNNSPKRDDRKIVPRRDLFVLSLEFVVCSPLSLTANVLLVRPHMMCCENIILTPPAGCSLKPLAGYSVDSYCLNRNAV